MNEKTYNKLVSEGQAYLSKGASQGGFMTCYGGASKGQFACYGKTISIKCKKGVYAYGALAMNQQDYFKHPHPSPKVSGRC